MQIKFDIDTEKKLIRVFFKNSEMQKWAKEGLKENPEMTSEEIAEQGAKVITHFLGKTFNHICEAHKLNVNEFTLEPKDYTSEEELPIQLRN